MPSDLFAEDDGGVPAIPSIDCESRDSLDCTQLTLAIADDVDLVQLSGISLRHVSLAVQARHSSVVELVDVLVNDVVATLEGPVTLRVTDSVSVVNLRVVAAEGAAQGVDFEAHHCVFTNLWIGTSKAPFPGGVRIDETRLQQSQVEAQEVSLESSTLVAGRLGAERLDAVDVTIRNSEIAMGSGLLSAVVLDTCEVTRCGQLTLVEGEVFDTRIAPCTTGPFRAYSSTLNTADVSGAIESEHSDWYRTVFGAQTAGPLVFWGGDGVQSTFCEDLPSVMFDAKTGWTCNACPNGFAQADAVCALPDIPSYSPSSHNPCSQFDVPVECSPPFPENVRRAGPSSK